MGSSKQSLLPFVGKTLATAIMAAAIGACSSNDNEAARQPTNKGDLPALPAADAPADPRTNEYFEAGEVSENGYTIEVIQNCGVAPDSATNSTVFAGESLQGGGDIAGHAASAEEAIEEARAAGVEEGNLPLNPWDNLQYHPESPRYDLANLPVQEDESCNGVETKTGILVTKYADWDHQHSNEFNPEFDEATNQTFGDIENIVLEFKLNKDQTHIPTKEAIDETYSEYLNPYAAEGEEFNFDRLDQWKAVIAVTVQSEPWTDAATRVSAERYIVIDQEKYADEWVRVTIPVDTMDFFTGEVWEKNSTTLEAQAATPVGRVHVVGEILAAEPGAPTTYGDVVRNLIARGDDTVDYTSLRIPETFKEMALTVRKVEVVWEE